LSSLEIQRTATKLTEVGQVADLRRHGAAESVVLDVQLFKTGQVPHFDWKRPVEGRELDEQGL